MSDRGTDDPNSTIDEAGLFDPMEGDRHPSEINELGFDDERDLPAHWSDE